MRNLNILKKALIIALVLTLSIFQSAIIAAADTLILDNGQLGTSFNGTWKVSGGVNPYGRNSLYASANGASYTFDVDLATPGEYQVFAWWTEWSNTGTSEFIVDFDAPTPPGSSNSLLSGVFEGIDFGQGQWRWEGAWDANPSNHVFFDSSSGQSRNFQFAQAPAVLTGMRVSAATSGVLTLSDDAGQTFTKSLSAGRLTLIETGWTQAATTVTVNYSAGWELAVDDVRYVAESAGGGTGDGTSRRTSVPIDITHLGGTSTVTVNQRLNGGQWNQLGTTWNFDTTATIAIRSLGNGTTSADAIKLVYVGNNTALPVFPVDLRGNTPEQASITINTTKPAGATSGIITLTTYDADFPNEGELVINGNSPVALFGASGVSGNDQNSADISFSTPASYWRNGDNTLLFRHTRTQGYVIDAVAVSFEAAITAPKPNTPPKINGSPATAVTAGNNYVFQPSASDADGDPLTFSITNRPAWASFNNKTGRLSGTPGSAGTFNNIRISVSDGQSTDALPTFSITVNNAAPQTGSGFPVDLRGSTPEQASITINTTKPAGATSGVITLTTYDADFPNEGELVINGNSPVTLFGASGISGNDQNSADISFSTPASYWRNGDNTLLFRHTRTQGYVIDAVAVSFEAATTAPKPNTPPKINGSPATAVTAGNNYVFQPSASDADGDPLTFSITNRPAWASFNNKTGRLSGTPGSAGTFNNIRISVSDGQSTDALPTFSITVNAAAAQTGSVSLSWTAPVSRADGSALALSEISGYTVYYGTSSGNHPNSLTINDGSATSATITDLPLGTFTRSLQRWTPVVGKAATRVKW